MATARRLRCHDFNLTTHIARDQRISRASLRRSAAGVLAAVIDLLRDRVQTRIIPRIRDNALIAIGRAHADITAALLSTLNGSRLATANHPNADVATRLGKAAGVDTAYRTVVNLAPLVGAVGFQRGHPIAKARADLVGLLYADGVHDSLYRSGGQALMSLTRSATVVSMAASRVEHEERPDGRAA